MDFIEDIENGSKLKKIKKNPWVIYPTNECGDRVDLYFNKTGEISDDLLNLFKLMLKTKNVLHCVHVCCMFSECIVGSDFDLDAAEYVSEDFGISIDSLEKMCKKEQGRWTYISADKYDEYIIDNNFPSVRFLVMDGWC